MHNLMNYKFLLCNILCFIDLKLLCESVVIKTHFEFEIFHLSHIVGSGWRPVALGRKEFDTFADNSAQISQQTWQKHGKQNWLD